MTANSIFSCIPLVLRDGSPALVDVIDISPDSIIGVTTNVRPGEMIKLPFTGDFAQYLDKLSRRAS